MFGLVILHSLLYFNVSYLSLIHILLGKIKENYFKDAINEYKKMLKSYADLSIFEIMDEPCPENLSDKDMEKVKNVEGEKILSKIKDGAYVIALEIGGKSLDSVAFADKIKMCIRDSCC